MSIVKERLEFGQAALLEYSQMEIDRGERLGLTAQEAGAIAVRESGRVRPRTIDSRTIDAARTALRSLRSRTSPA